MVRFLLSIVIFMLVSGCISNLQWKQPTKDPRASFHEAYEKCLAQHPEDKSKCDEYLGSHVEDSGYFRGASEHPEREGYH